MLIRSLHRPRPRCAELRLLPGRARLSSWVATPSGITLSPLNGGAHQSIAQPLIGLAQDGLAAFGAGFRRRAGIHFGLLRSTTFSATGRGIERATIGCAMRLGAPSVSAPFHRRPVEQISWKMTPALSQAIVDGACAWLREPGPNCEVVVAYTGAVALERRSRPSA